MSSSENVPELRTRKPSGKPSWPMILLAGAEKSGKSWSWATFSGSNLIDRTFVIEVGEGAADAYGAVPGARFEIVEHDGSFRSIGQAAKAIRAQPTNGKPHCIVVDSMTEVWDLLSDEQQIVANERARQKAEKFKRPLPDEDATITMDQWNAAKKRWRALLDVLRGHDGPVILTARFEKVAVVDAAGQPTTEKTWKIRAEKNLPFEVDVIVEVPKPRDFYLTGLRSTTLHLPPGAHEPFPDFTVDGLLRKMGLDESTETQARVYVAPRPEALNDERQPSPAEVAGASEGLTAHDLPRNKDGSVSHSQITDEQKAAVGIMTAEQMKEHTALQAKKADSKQARAEGRVEKLTAVPDTDPWVDSPGGELNLPEPESQKWCDGWVVRVEAADSVEMLDLLGAELTSVKREGRIATPQFEHCKAVGANRKAELTAPVEATA